VGKKVEGGVPIRDAFHQVSKWPDSGSVFMGFGTPSGVGSEPPVGSDPPPQDTTAGIFRRAVEDILRQQHGTDLSNVAAVDKYIDDGSGKSVPDNVYEMILHARKLVKDGMPIPKAFDTVEGWGWTSKMS